MQSGHRRLTRMAFPALVLLCAAALTAGIVSKFYAYYVWDDSYMFVRYADSVIHSGAILWNRGGEPTYGLTSLLYLVVVIPVRLIVSGNPTLAAAIPSVICGVFFILLLTVVLRRYYSPDGTGARIPVGFALASLALASDHVSAHFMSGMDTMFAMCYVTAYLLLIHHHELRPGRRSAVTAGIVGGLAFFARPDLLIYAFIVPAALVVFSRKKSLRTYALEIIGITVLTAGLQMALAYLYFGSPLPLPFYAKSTNLYGTFIRSQYSSTAYRQFKTFGLSYAPVFVAIAAAAGMAPRRWWQALTGSEKGMLFGSVVFLGYYFFGVLQIMPFHARFYHPALPGLMMIACRSLPVIGRSCRELIGGGFRGNPGRYAGTIAVTACIAVIMPEVIANYRESVRTVRTDFRMNDRENNYCDFNILSIYRKFLGDGFLFRLEQFSSLPDDLSMATTEVGILSALNPGKTVIDLAGLNQREFALRPFSADTLFAKFHPDLIYLPHPHYQRMINGIISHPIFTTDYDYYRGPEIDALMGVAIRRESVHYVAMKTIILDRIAYLQRIRAKGPAPSN